MNYYYFRKFLTNQEKIDTLCNYMRVSIAHVIADRKEVGDSESPWLEDWMLANPICLRNAVVSFIDSIVHDNCVPGPELDPEVVRHYLGEDFSPDDVLKVRSWIGKVSDGPLNKVVSKDGAIDPDEEYLYMDAFPIIVFMEWMFDQLYRFCIKMAETLEDVHECVNASKICGSPRTRYDILSDEVPKKVIQILDPNGITKVLMTDVDKECCEAMKEDI